MEEVDLEVVEEVQEVWRKCGGSAEEVRRKCGGSGGSGLGSGGTRELGIASGSAAIAHAAAGAVPGAWESHTTVLSNDSGMSPHR